ncbi:MAG: hypothetical protein JO323_25820 [Acidobacteriia bacterium]|nr:hypothetical protein [Terriglobia bacterium]
MHLELDKSNILEPFELVQNVAPNKRGQTKGWNQLFRLALKVIAEPAMARPKVAIFTADYSVGEDYEMRLLRAPFL